MEFIRYSGDLQCPACREVENNRIVYNQFLDGSQIYLFVCGRCKEWIRVDFGCEPAGTISADLRRRLKDPDYGSNW
jgi:hypothetical protein